MDTFYAIVVTILTALALLFGASALCTRSGTLTVYDSQMQVVEQVDSTFFFYSDNHVKDLINNKEYSAFAWRFVKD